MSKIVKKKAQKAITESLPIMIKLFENPKFVAAIEKSGNRLDTSAIFNLFTDAAAAGADMNKIFRDAKKMKNGK